MRLLQSKVKPEAVGKLGEFYKTKVIPELQKIKEFIEIYKREIIPALQATDGCLHAYLMENLQEKEQEEVISITIWESKEKAEQYEKSGQFDRLVEKVKHTFTTLSQWQMSLEKEQGKQAKTSDDLSVSHYTMVAGRRFK